MDDRFRWSAAEKRVARRAFERALDAELAELVADFKARAAAAVEADDLWTIRDHLDRRQREIEQKYDYRYSQMDHVLGRLLREKRIEQADLVGLSDDKLGAIRRVASL